MAKHLWTLLCQQAIVDRFTNNLTIVSVIEKLDIRLQLLVPLSKLPDPLPAPVYSLTVVSLWKRSDDDESPGSVRVRCSLPSGKELAVSPELPLEIAAEKAHGRTLMRFEGLPIVEDGDYLFKVQQQRKGRWKTEHTTSLAVRKIFPAQSGKQQQLN